MTNLKHPNIKGLYKEVPDELVADYLASGWLNPSAKKPKAEPKAALNSPATDENTDIKENL